MADKNKTTGKNFKQETASELGVQKVMGAGKGTTTTKTTTGKTTGNYGQEAASELGVNKIMNAGKNNKNTTGK